MRILRLTDSADSLPDAWLAERLGIPVITQTSLPTTAELEVVAISPSREGSIERGCAQAAQSGRHVVAPMDLAIATDRWEQHAAACGANNRQLQVANLWRFLPAIDVVHQRLAQGVLGIPGLLRIHRWQAPGELPSSDRLWRDIDLACWLFDALPTTAYCRRSAEPAGAWNEAEYVQIHLGFPEGGMALLDDSRTLPPGDNYFSLSMIGSRGAAYADDHHDRQLQFSGGPARARKASSQAMMELARLRHFLAQLENSAVDAGLSAVRRVEQVLEALQQSVEHQQAVALPS